MQKEQKTEQNLDHISVCICTYQRPALLATLLGELQHQESGGLFSFSIIVVDNDFRRSAESEVAFYAEKTGLNIRYYVEGIQNISLARNKAIQNADGDFIAFIDDDEIPERNWLYNLYRALLHFDVDAVLGPVLPYYEASPPNWVLKGKFYERPTYPTGFRIDWKKGRTGNILLKKKVFLASGELFDSNFGSGGEDQDFARRVIKKGFVFIWCNEARAYEVVPPLRWNRLFMIKRALLRGKMAWGYSTSRFIMLMKSLIAIPVYVMALPLLFVLGQHVFMQYVIKIFDHSGRILAGLKLSIIRQKYITRR